MATLGVPLRFNWPVIASKSLVASTTSKLSVEFELRPSVDPSVNVPIPVPPGAKLFVPVPALTAPLTRPTVPLASVPPLSVTAPVPVAEPVVFVTRNVPPPLIVVPPV